jgi:hypothetical protein
MKGLVRLQAEQSYVPAQEPVGMMFANGSTHAN